MAFKKAARYRGLYIIPELKKGREAWGFNGEEGNSQEGERRKWMVNRVCLARWKSLRWKSDLW